VEVHIDDAMHDKTHRDNTGIRQRHGTTMYRRTAM